MPRVTRFFAALFAVALLAALAAAAGGTEAASGPSASGSTADGPVAVAAARRCGLSRREQRGGLGTTYVLKVSVRGTTCRGGKNLVKVFHRCRPGRAGRCSRVRGWRCSEKRFNKSRFSYDSNVRCTRGGKRVWHTYTQNL